MAINVPEEKPVEGSDFDLEANEDPMRVVSKRLFKMEEDLLNLAKEQEFNEYGDSSPIRGVYIHCFSDGQYQIYSSVENLRTIKDASAPLTFHCLSADDFEYGKQIGVRSKMELIVGIPTDWESRPALEEYIEQNPNADTGWTGYFFQEDGSYGKIVAIPKKIKLTGDRTILNSGNSTAYLNVCQSVMTPQDFEIAGTALKMLIDRLQSTKEDPKEGTLPLI